MHFQRETGKARAAMKKSILSPAAARVWCRETRGAQRAARQSPTLSARIGFRSDPKLQRLGARAERARGARLGAARRGTGAHQPHPTGWRAGDGFTIRSSPGAQAPSASCSSGMASYSRPGTRRGPIVCRSATGWYWCRQRRLSRRSAGIDYHCGGFSSRLPRPLRYDRYMARSFLVGHRAARVTTT